MAMTDDVSAMLFESPFGKLTDELLDMGREAARLWLDAYEQALESIGDAGEGRVHDEHAHAAGTALRHDARDIGPIGQAGDAGPAEFEDDPGRGRGH